MNYNTQNAKIASITEKTLIVGIDVGSVTHYARAFDRRITSIPKSRWNSATQKKGSLHSRHGWKILQKNTVKPL